MSIQNLDEERLKALIKSYKRFGKTEGKKYSLAEASLETVRRVSESYNGHDVALAIVEIARASKDGLVSYLEMWQHFNPKSELKGSNCQQEAGDMMGAAAYFCATFPNGPLPIVTVAVVRPTNREVADTTKKNMWNAANNWGLKPDANINAWYESQLDGTRNLTKGALDVNDGEKRTPHQKKLTSFKSNLDVLTKEMAATSKVNEARHQRFTNGLQKQWNVEVDFEKKINLEVKQYFDTRCYTPALNYLEEAFGKPPSKLTEDEIKSVKALADTFLEGSFQARGLLLVVEDADVYWDIESFTKK